MQFENWVLRSFALFYQTLIKIGSNLESIFLLYMRLTWGHQLFLIGTHKWQHIAQTAEFFSQLGMGHSSWLAYAIGSLEILSGICLILGLASRLIAIPLICLLITALSTAHAEDLTRFEFLLTPAMLALQAPYPYLITAILMFIFGPGKISFDYWIQKKIKERYR